MNGNGVNGNGKMAPKNPITRELLEEILAGTLSQDREVQRQTIARHFSSDIELYHPALRTKNRVDYYKAFRAYQSFAETRPEIKEVLIEGDKAFVWVDQHVILKFIPFSALRPLVLPTLVLLYFKHGSDGRPIVVKHIDHFSTFGLIWSFGSAARWLHESLVQPLGNKVLSFQGTVSDYFADWCTSAQVQLKQKLNASKAGNY